MSLMLYEPKPIELGDRFDKIPFILDLAQHPEVAGIPLETIREKQAQLLQERVLFLAKKIEDHSLELGAFLLEAPKLGLHLVMGYTSIYSWLFDGLGISREVLTLASDRYKGWRYIKPYGFSPDDVRKLGREKLQRLADITRDTDRQKRIIAERLHDEEPSLKEQERIAEADQEFYSQMRSEIDHILTMRPEDLLEERATTGGEAIRPDFTLSNWRYDPSTGRMTAQVRADLEIGHLLALQRGQLRVLIQEPTGEKVSLQEFAQLLLYQREEYEFDREDDD